MRHRGSWTLADAAKLTGKSVAQLASELSTVPEPATGSHRIGGRYVQRGTAGRAPDLGRIWWRSQSERNYARWLTSQGIAWQYEPKTFVFERIRSGTRTYKPDFYLPERQEYHEVKGWRTRKDETKLRRMRKYFPQETIVVIPKSWFRDICRQRVCLLIPHYECPHQIARKRV